MTLEPGYYWLRTSKEEEDQQEDWEILLYDDVFNEFYRMGTQVAIGPEDLNIKDLIRVAFPLCTHKITKEDKDGAYL